MELKTNKVVENEKQEAIFHKWVFHWLERVNTEVVQEDAETLGAKLSTGRTSWSRIHLDEGLLTARPDNRSRFPRRRGHIEVSTILRDSLHSPLVRCSPCFVPR